MIIYLLYQIKSGVFLAGSGFKVEYSVAGCSRTHSEPYGRIFSPGIEFYSLEYISVL